MLKERLAPRLTKKRTNWRDQCAAFKIAATLRFLATGETYISLHYHLRAGKATISKCVIPVCRAMIDEFMLEHLTCPPPQRTGRTWRLSLG